MCVPSLVSLEMHERRLQLIKRAALRLPIRSPAHEACRVAEPVSVEAVELDLAHAIGTDGHPIHGHVGGPPTGGALESSEWAGLDREALGPRVLLERDR